MEHWWSDVERELLQCLRGNGAMAPRDVARTVGLSEASTTSLLAMLAREGQIRICLVECVGDGAATKPPASAPARRASRRKGQRVA